jgi:hypothetical protein
MRIVPSIDLEKGRSRIVFWPGASTGVGAPTDQPARIARHFVDHGATLIHLVDFDGARAGAPQNLAAIGAVAGLVATPLQVAPPFLMSLSSSLRVRAQQARGSPLVLTHVRSDSRNFHGSARCSRHSTTCCSSSLRQESAAW